MLSFNEIVNFTLSLLLVNKLLHLQFMYFSISLVFYVSVLDLLVDQYSFRVYHSVHISSCIRCFSLVCFRCRKVRFGCASNKRCSVLCLNSCPISTFLRFTLSLTL